MTFYTVYPDDVTLATPTKLLTILQNHGISTEWIEYIGSLKGISPLWVTTRCVEIINQNNIKLPDNIFGVTSNPITEGDY